MSWPKEGLFAGLGLCAVIALTASDPVCGRNLKAETVMKIDAPFTVAAVGDIIMPQPLYDQDPRFQKLVDIMRRSDVGFANMEMSLVDFRRFHGPVQGTEAPLDTGEAIKAMGINIVNHANNHTFDGGVAGMVSTDQALDKLGIAHAGTGMNLQEARAARYLETPKGRVGLVGIFAVDDVSEYGPGYARTEATYRNGDLAGAPGVDPLRLTAYHVVSPGQLRILEGLSRSIYGDAGDHSDTTPQGSPERFRFFDEWYQAGSSPGDIHYEMNPQDEADILSSIRNAKVYSDFVIVAIHVHQSSSYRTLLAGLRLGLKEGLDHATPDFLVRLAHESIDSGADMFVAEGVHALRGVEIYHGKPIFYGLSNFVFQFGLQFGPSYDVLDNERHLAALENPASQVTVLTQSKFENGRLSEVRLYPVALGGAARPLSRMGIPLLPDSQGARRILQALQKYSESFRTRIGIEGDVGIIRVGPAGR